MATLSPQDPTLVCEHAEALMHAGQYADAHALLQPAAQQWPTHATVQWYAGRVAQQQGHGDIAIAQLRWACTLDPRLDDAAFELAWALHDHGEFDEARYWALHAISAQPTAPRHLQTGWLLQHHQQFADAIPHYQAAIAAYPAAAAEQPTLHIQLAECHLALGAAAVAVSLLETALQRCPDAAPRLGVPLAHLYWQQGDAVAAIALARQLTESEPEQVEHWYRLGAFLHDSGDWLAADPCFDQVQRRDLSHSDALFRRAQIQARAGRPADALWLLQHVIHHRPEATAAHALMAQVLLDLARPEDARRVLVRNLRRQRQQAELWRLLAVVHQQQGRNRLAQRALQRALKDQPDHIEALRMLIWVTLAQDDRATTLALTERLAQRHPDDLHTQTQVAFVHALIGDLARAAHCAERAVAQAPHHAEAWRALSQVRYQQQRLREAEYAINIAQQRAPDRVDSVRQLGWILIAQHQLAHAELAFLRAQTLAPRDPVVLLELAEVRLRAGQFVAGLETLDALQALGPLSLAAQRTQAQLWIEGGQALQRPEWHRRALAQCQQRLMIPSQQAEVAQHLVRLRSFGVEAARPLCAMLPHSQWRLSCQEAMNHAVTHHGDADLQQLAALVRDAFPDQPWLMFASLYAESLSASSQAPTLAWRARDGFRALSLRHGLQPAWSARQGPREAGRLRIAYVASQAHAPLLHGVLAHHDPSQVEVFVYSSAPLSGLPQHIHCQPLEVAHLAAACRANHIDIVIDTGGLHPFEGQYALLECYAKRLAPVQVGWLGSWGTAGGLFDAMLTDAIAIPPERAADYDEALWPIDGGAWSWTPPAYAPEPQPLPARFHGWVTFGIVARGLRINEDSLRAWAAVLVALPLSRLCFVGQVSQDWPQRAAILACLQRSGVDPERIIFDAPCDDVHWLNWFQGIDLVLDTFPGNGGLSLLDALWMGVPVVSRAGDWAGARQGASILHSIGCPHWVAHSEADFVARAVALASDIPALEQTRRTLRARLSESPLRDGRRVARHIEAHCAAYFARHPSLTSASDDLKQAVRHHAQRGLRDWLDKPNARVVLPDHGSEPPALSVIVILYNQAGLTLRTLQALADQRGASFETILIDNASTDDTDALLARVDGAQIVRNPRNMGFLLAANQGAARARGRHLVLLNNDAIVHAGALAATCEHLDADPSMGALGGRVVLMSGGVQEVGNQIFQDGSTAGIGRGEDPFAPAALIRRDTDYCSGVYLAIRRPLWAMLGGFDPTFAPAYYEDTDLCVRVWQAGFRVVYCPDIVLTHLEWGSAALHQAPQQMRDNRVRFVAKHQDWLQRQPRPRRLSLHDDFWRSPADRPRKPRVLILDNEVPHMARGGGLPRARLMLQALRDWPVTLFPLWSFDDDWAHVYASIPNTVEVILGQGLAQLEHFLEQRQGFYEVLWVSRPPNLHALAPLRARRPELFAGIRIIYDSEALFALREIGECAIKGQPLTPERAQARLNQELDLAQGVEQVVVVSERDARPFRARGHAVSILSHAMPVRYKVPNPKRRAGLLFIGALHPDTPNEDGLLWFIEQVLPHLNAMLPTPPTVEIVGECRSVRIAAQAQVHAQIQLCGAQADLRPCYDRAKVFIAPVRFAGGVPVKVIEAAAQGIPVVASAILVRQLGWQAGLDIQSARDAEAFAQGVARLLNDEALWRRQQAAAWARCAADYHPDDFALHTQALLLGHLKPEAV